jgi:nucleotide-binding universal stress UspA family protein
MIPDNPMDFIKVESIFHPSDFSQASHVAFAHALKIALVAKAKLSMLHATAKSDADWQDFPGVRDTLERWGILPKNSPSTAVVDMLGIEVGKVIAAGKDPVRACVGYLKKHPADLIVLAVHPREGRMQWLEKSVGEPIASAAGQMTLFIPHGVQGFVSVQDGSVHLSNILIPVATKPRPQPAVEAAARLIRNLGLAAGTVTLLHAGKSAEMPSVQTPEIPGWTWKRVAQEGKPAEVILQTAAETGAELVLMTTDGPEGFLDALRGTTSELVLREIRCPVANLPAGSMLG